MIIQRKRVEIECIDCGSKMLIRSDYAKTHKGRCQRCTKLELWSRPELAKQYSDSHKGKGIKKLEYGESNFNMLYMSYLKSAEARGIYFDISVADFRKMSKENCYYCGVEPLQMYSKNVNWNGFWLHNGIDRKDDNIGYVDGNCVPSCKLCNYAKQGLTDSEFLLHIKKIYKKHFESDQLGGSNLEYTK